MTVQVKAAIFALIGVLTVVFVWAWQVKFAQSNYLVVYFERPKTIWQYLLASSGELILPSIYCFLTALGCVVLAGIVAALLIIVGLSSNYTLTVIQSFGAFSQTVPTLVIVILFLVVERELAKLMHIELSTDWFCILPVTVGLMFPPLVNGANAILRMPLQIKALLRIWNAPPGWRKWKIYLPYVAPEILSGLRASATWAVSSTLIAEAMINGVANSNRTLGYFLVRPFSQNQKTTAVVILSSVLGYAVYWLSGFLERAIEKRLFGKVVIREAAYPLQSAQASHEEKVYASST